MKALRYVGIMANYRCTAACRHCLYASSPQRNDGYIAVDTARRVCGFLRAHGLDSVHIGGGEPFLDFEGLLSLVQVVRESGLLLEYIETNAYWAAEEDEVRQRLQRLKAAGAGTLLVSIDPFHAEYVPLERPLFLVQMCEREGMDYFVWKQQFVSPLAKLDVTRAHSCAELQQALSPTYVLDTATAYGLRFGGRALAIEEECMPRRPLEDVLQKSPCRELLSASGFHVDWEGKYVPSGCTGMLFPLEEAVEGLPAGDYPVAETLMQSGVAGLYEYAAAKGFAADARGYTSSCGLCFYLRRWLARHAPTPELDAEFYEAARAYI